MSEYPILVKRFTGQQSLTIVCEACHTEDVIGEEDILNEGIYLCPLDSYGKPTVCGGFAIYKYDEGDECPGCRTLGFYDPNALGGCCSRVCQLQAEYAAELKARRAA